MKKYYYYHPESGSLMSSDSKSLHDSEGLLEPITSLRAMELKKELGIDIEHVLIDEPVAIWMTDPHLSMSTIDLNISIYNQVFDIAKNRGIKTIYLGGDVFESRNAQPEGVLTVFGSILKQASSMGLIIRAIPGNHDKTNYVNESSFLDVYEPYHSFELIRSASYYDHSQLRIHMVPYFDEKLIYKKYLDIAVSNIDKRKNNVLLTHIGIDGVLNNSKDCVENELGVPAFRKFDHVYIGHFHDRQGVPPNISYTGSCYQANFGEDSDKGCGIIKPNGEIEYIKLSFKEYHTIQVENNLSLEDVNKIIHDKNSSTSNLKVQFVGAKQKISQESISMLRSEGIKVENKQEEEILGGDQSSFQGTFKADHIKDSFEEWVKEKEGLVNVKYGREKIKSIL